MADIIEEVGITPPVFYSHFASKQDLFVEAFGLFVDWMKRSLDTRLPGEANREAREVSRAADYYYGVRSVGFDLLSLVRSEAVREDSELREPARDAMKHMVSGSHEDPVKDELAAFALFGVMDSIVTRACWDDTYDAADVLWTIYAFTLGLRAVYTGKLDVGEDVKRDAELINNLAHGHYQAPLPDLLP